LLEGKDLGCTGCHQDIDLRADELLGDAGQEVWPVSCVPAHLNRNVLTLDIA
jgi:hypothetical protein